MSDLQDLKARLAMHVDRLVRELLPGGVQDGQEWRAGSTAGNEGGSLGVHLVGSKAGVWKDFGDGGKGGDLLDLIQACRGGTTAEAIKWAWAWLGEPVARPRQGRRRPPAPPPKPPTAEDVQKRSWARDLWGRAWPAEGTLVETYLRSRGIDLPVPPVLRFVPSLKHGPSGGRFPAMVAIVHDPQGVPVAVHRTYLAGDGRGKAPVSETKMILGTGRTAAVRLFPAGEHLAVAEGIETALAARQLRPDLPVWAAISASWLKSIVLPPGVRQVTILADHDLPDDKGRCPGQDAARVVAERLRAEGRRVGIALPPEPGDWLDVLNSRCV